MELYHDSPVLTQLVKLLAGAVDIETLTPYECNQFFWPLVEQTQSAPRGLVGLRSIKREKQLAEIRADLGFENRFGALKEDVERFWSTTQAPIMVQLVVKANTTAGVSVRDAIYQLTFQLGQKNLVVLAALYSECLLSELFQPGQERYQPELFDALASKVRSRVTQAVIPAFSPMDYQSLTIDFLSQLDSMGLIDFLPVKAVLFGGVDAWVTLGQEYRRWTISEHVKPRWSDIAGRDYELRLQEFEAKVEFFYREQLTLYPILRDLFIRGEIQSNQPANDWLIEQCLTNDAPAAIRAFFATGFGNVVLQFAGQPHPQARLTKIGIFRVQRSLKDSQALLDYLSQGGYVHTELIKPLMQFFFEVMVALLDLNVDRGGPS